MELASACGAQIGGPVPVGGLRVEPWVHQALVRSCLVLRGQEELWGRPGHATLLIMTASDYIIDARAVETVSQVSHRFSQN